MESRFRKAVRAMRDGWTAGKAEGGEVSGNEGRFVVKPGEVKIIPGGGAKVDRKPGEPRGR